MKKIYEKRMTYSKYDESHIIGYLNEKEVENVAIDEGMEGEPKMLEHGFEYEGTQSDGGTIMPYTGEPDYGKIVDAIIGTRYSRSEEMAIHRHRLESMESSSNIPEDVLAKYDEEWEEYNAFCENAKSTAKCWLA